MVVVIKNLHRNTLKNAKEVEEVEELEEVEI